MRLYDTLSRKKREFKPLEGGIVRIYTCGPSVYDYSHIGNFRTYLFEDVLVRYLRYKGYKVKRVMNITDIEDKAVSEARRQGKTLSALQRGKIRAFFEDFRSLGMEEPDVVAKASDHVPDMIRLIQRICGKGYCIYEKDGVYFDVRKFRRYGRLRRLRRPRYLGEARRDDYSKEGLWDFRLWKRWSRWDRSACWESPFGDGRPGWHIECSAMAMRYLGESFDIHCGGTDNIFPHHENEIAQSEAASGRPLSNFWLHCKHLTVNKRKMSKRTGNVHYVRDLLDEGIHSKCLRFYLISKRYRSRLDFNYREFRRRVCSCEDLPGLIREMRRSPPGGDGRWGAALAKAMLSDFEDAMDDDLNTSLAFRRLFGAAERIRRRMGRGKLTAADAARIERAVRRMDEVLGIL